MLLTIHNQDGCPEVTPHPQVNQEVKETVFISIIIPVKVPNHSMLEGLKKCLFDLANSTAIRSLGVEVIVVNDSNETVYDVMEKWFANSSVKHIKLSSHFRNGANNKLNSIQAALEFASGEYVLLLDDDCRPNVDTILSMTKHLPCFECVRFMVKYETPSLIDTINLCGIFVINMLSPEKQFWGNIAFHRQTLMMLGFPRKDCLFDELAFDRKFRNARLRIGYVSSVMIPMVSNTTYKKFLEQRVRYAYENIAYPIRFISHLCVIPSILLTVFFDPTWLLAILAIALITISIMAAAYIGQRRYSGFTCPSWVWLLTPIWFWFYPVTSWVALMLYLRGGIKFGGRRIRRPL